MGLAAAAGAIALALGAAGHSQPADSARGFDHLVHEGKVSVAGAEPIPCADCHPLDRRGHLAARPAHPECFDACHGDAPAEPRRGRRYAIDDQRRPVCEVCHQQAELARLEAGRTTSLSKRPQADEDYGLDFPHAAHADASRCRDCHAAPEPALRDRGHPGCAGCHGAGDASPTMDECEACHRAAYGPATRPHLVRGTYPVTDTFSHAEHAPRVPDDRDCTICHAAVAETDANDLPVPSMATCETCHDGTRAFSTVGATCTRCHRRPDFPVRRDPSPVRRFSHRQHRDRGLELRCARCHQLDPDGIPLPPAADHEPCSDSGCHHDEFASTEATICSGCHVGNEPWRHLHDDRPPPVTSEVGARFDHRAHLGGDGGPVDRACSDCHQTRSPGRDRRLGRDHADCTGDGCHDDGTAPQIPDCTGCHELGLVAARAAARTRARWSVRARFDHRAHRTDPRDGSSVACTDCHRRAADSRSVLDMPTPDKPTCAGCHDGQTAFKVTGHGCARCHGP